eukprot:TRINITY_DN1453_c0_g1_i5.p1 TRINITY_DN1453_c0_g1~~TRINITY_DN1453_c0_g1_i5.p1  ORF type:complete len:600 (-),score=84.46 TRINITY_DN1453_c0_g1_i5:48-1847(-)
MSTTCNVRSEHNDAEVSKVISIFRSFDVHGLGRITRDEMGRLLWTLNPAFDERKLDRLCSELDKSKDGFIEYEDFVKWLFGSTQIVERLRLPVRPRTMEVTVTLDKGPCCHFMADQEMARGRDLRLRAVCALGIPVGWLGDLDLLCDGQVVADDVKAADLRSLELRAVLRKRPAGLIISACGSDVSWWRLKAMTHERKCSTSDLVHRVSVSRQLQLIATATSNCNVVVWDASSGQELWRLMLHSQLLNCMDFGSECLYAATEDGVLVAWDARSGVERWRAGARGNVDGIQHMFCAGSEPLIFAGTDAGRVFAWNGQTGKELWRKTHGDKAAEVIAFTGDREAVFSASSCLDVCSWRAQDGQALWRTSSMGSLRSMVRFGKLLWLSTNAGWMLGVCASFGVRLSETRFMGGQLLRGPCNLIFAYGSNHILAFDTERQEELWRYTSEDGQDDEAVCCGTSSGTLVLLAATTGFVIAGAEVGGRVTTLAHMPAAEPPRGSSAPRLSLSDGTAMRPTTTNSMERGSRNVRGHRMLGSPTSNGASTSSSPRPAASRHLRLSSPSMSISCEERKMTSAAPRTSTAALCRERVTPEGRRGRCFPAS